KEGEDIIYFFSFPTIWIMGAIYLSANSISSLYDVNQPPLLQEIIFGLKTLICIFPIIVLVISIFAISRYTLDGENLVKMKEQLQNLHDKKKSKL
ncbi:unnamed protein product, partial [marine sediment metagenome]